MLRYMLYALLSRFELIGFRSLGGLGFMCSRHDGTLRCFVRLYALWCGSGCFQYGIVDLLSPFRVLLLFVICGVQSPTHGRQEGE